MGRANIFEVGKRFSSEYQPAHRGRKKGSRNFRTIAREYFRAMEPETTEEKLNALLDAIFGKKRARRVRRKLPPLPAVLARNDEEIRATRITIL